MYHKTSGHIALILGGLTATIPTLMLVQAVTYLFFVPLVLGLSCILLGISALRGDSFLNRTAGWLAFVIMVVAIGLPFGMISYHNRSGYPIVFVIPNDYRGPVRLIIDRDRGVDVRLLDEVYTYHIPASGTLLIQDDRPFRQWHSTRASFTNGKKIPVDFEGDYPHDTVLLHSLGSGVRTKNGKTEEFIEYFVGTKIEFRKDLDKS